MKNQTARPCRYFICAGLLLACCQVVLAKEPTPAPPKTLEFDNQILHLAWQGGEPGEPIREYIPKGETLDHWTHLASIREFSGLDDPGELAADTLKLTRESYPNTPSSSIENPTTGDTIIDFCAWPADQSFLEYNVFKYSKRPGGGIIAWQYAVRVYGDATEFTKTLPALRERLVNEMATTGLEPR